MVALKEKVLSEALSLSPIDRAELIERVYSSFDFSSKEEIDEKWAIEAESRIKAFEEGKIQRVSVDDVFAGINNGWYYMKISFLKIAQIEFEEAVDYYNHQSEGLGFDFALEVWRRLFIIKKPALVNCIHRQVIVYFEYEFNIIYSIKYDATS